VSIVCPAKLPGRRAESLRWAWVPESFFFASTFFGLPFFVGGLTPEIVPTTGVFIADFSILFAILLCF
jgi:hypothetical protein